MSEDPRLLILETSGRTGSIGLAQGHSLVQRHVLDASQKQARDLVPTLKSLLEQQNWRPRDLNGVIVSLGPGSYTGLRVGISSAKALAYAVDAKVIGIETFAALAAQVPEGVQSVDVIADAQQKKIYAQSYVREGSECWRAVSELGIVGLEGWLTRRDSLAWISGPGVSKYQGELSGNVKLVPADLRSPQLESLLRLGMQSWQEDKFADLWTIEPIYLRPSAAEEQWERRQRSSK